MNDSIFVDPSEEHQADQNKVKIFDSLIDADEILENRHASADPEGIKELAITRFLNRYDPTKEILNTIKDSPEGAEIAKLFHTEENIEPKPLVSKKEYRIPERDFLILTESEKKEDESKDSYTALLLERRVDSPYKLIGSQELTGLDEEALRECGRIVRNTRAYLEFLTKDLVKSVY